VGDAVSWLVQVWSVVMEETERLIELMQTSVDRLAVSILEVVTQIVAEKKLVRKLYAEKRNFMDMELDRVCSIECYCYHVSLFTDIQHLYLYLRGVLHPALRPVKISPTYPMHNIIFYLSYKWRNMWHPEYLY